MNTRQSSKSAFSCDTPMQWNWGLLALYKPTGTKMINQNLMTPQMAYLYDMHRPIFMPSLRSILIDIQKEMASKTINQCFAVCIHL